MSDPFAIKSETRTSPRSMSLAGRSRYRIELHGGAVAVDYNRDKALQRAREKQRQRPDDDAKLCPDCRGKGQYAGLDITCRRCNGTCVWRPEPVPTTTQRPSTPADDPDWLNPEKGGNRAGDDYWYS